MSLLPEVLSGEDGEAIHDLRVWSRRLQQTLDALHPPPRPRRIQAVRRILRRARRAVGEWRNCDVVLQLVERRMPRARGAARHRAWEIVREFAQARREEEIKRARHRLLRLDLAGLPAAVQKMVAAAPAPHGAPGALCPGVAAAWNEWQAALSHAREVREVPSLHAFRVVTKRLRYRLELVVDCGETDLGPVIDWLKKLQEALGAWHDRQMLYRMAAEAFARPELFLDEADPAQHLLAELRRDRRRDEPAIDDIVHRADDASPRALLESWIGA